MKLEAGSSSNKGSSWTGTSVDLEDIERELNRLWHETAGVDSGGPTPGRASVLNLLVLTCSDTDAEWVNQTVTRLSGRHPLRAIIVSAEPGHPQDSLDTAINTYCYEDPATGNQSCCEQVIIGANGEVANNLTGVITPLLIPDLPVYLWQMGKPQYESEMFQELLRSAQKLIIDSGTHEPTPDSFRRALDLSRSSGQVCAVNDLNWMRLGPWFEVIAQFFDDPALHPHLYGIERVSIEYAMGEGENPAASTQAVLLVGWLFSRLGERPPHVELKPTGAAGAPGGNIISFLMETRHGAETAVFHVARKLDGSPLADVRARVGEQEVVDRTVMIGESADADMLDVALETCHRDIPYEQALQIAAELLAREATR